MYGLSYLPNSGRGGATRAASRRACGISSHQEWALPVVWQISGRIGLQLQEVVKPDGGELRCGGVAAVHNLVPALCAADDAIDVAMGEVDAAVAE